MESWAKTILFGGKNSDICGKYTGIWGQIQLYFHCQLSVFHCPMSALHWSMFFFPCPLHISTLDAVAGNSKSGQTRSGISPLLVFHNLSVSKSITLIVHLFFLESFCLQRVPAVSSLFLGKVKNRGKAVRVYPN